MFPDTSTVSWFGHAVSVIQPSWSLTTLLILGGVVYLINQLLRNTRITQAIADAILGVNDIREIVKDIRANQILISTAVSKQGTQIAGIEDRLSKLEADFSTFRCQSGDTCPNRTN